MRLWHVKLIQYLPREQLLSQLRECVCIAKSIKEKNTPSHILVNKIIDYPIDEFNSYCKLVIDEFDRRSYKVSQLTKDKLKDYTGYNGKVMHSNIFKNWHNDDYLKICYYNLYEKYLCNGITKEDFEKIKKAVPMI